MVYVMVFFLICRYCKYVFDKGYLILIFCLENWICEWFVIKEEINVDYLVYVLMSLLILIKWLN